MATTALASPNFLSQARRRPQKFHNVSRILSFPFTPLYFPDDLSPSLAPCAALLFRPLSRHPVRPLSFQRSGRRHTLPLATLRDCVRAPSRQAERIHSFWRRADAVPTPPQIPQTPSFRQSVLAFERGKNKPFVAAFSGFVIFFFSISLFISLLRLSCCP